MNAVGVVVTVIMAIAVLVAVLMVGSVVYCLILAASAGVDVSLAEILGMRFRGVPPKVIIEALIQLHRAGIKNVSKDALEAHFLSGGDVHYVINTMVRERKSGTDPDFNGICAEDLNRSETQRRRG